MVTDWCALAVFLDRSTHERQLLPTRVDDDLDRRSLRLPDAPALRFNFKLTLHSSDLVALCSPAMASIGLVSPSIHRHALT